MKKELIRPPSRQRRSEIAGLDIKDSQVPELINYLRSLGFTENTEIIPGAYATVYIIPGQPGVRLPCKLRFRVYGLDSNRADRFQLRPGDIGVLEAKRKIQGYPYRIEDKQRETCTAAAVAELIRHPGAARAILATHRLAEIPSGYPDGRLDGQLLAELSRRLASSGELIPSLVIIAHRTHYVAYPEEPDRFRVTVDRGTRYYGYNPHSPQNLFEQPVLVGRDKAVRVEIKMVGDGDQRIVEQLLSWLAANGQRPHVRAKGYQAYFRRFFGVPARDALQPVYRTNEVEGREIEGKLTIIGDCPIERVAAVLYTAFDQGAGGDFEIHDVLRQMRESRTHAIRYGVLADDGTLSEAFVITPRPERHVVGIKRKTETIGVYGGHGNILDRSEELEDLVWPEWTPQAESEVVAQEAERLGVTPNRIVRVGESRRLKMRVYLIHQRTHRLYVISVERSLSPNGDCLQQIEIEYGGRSGIHSQNLDSVFVPQIVEDIESIQQVVLSVCGAQGIIVTPELLTKFDWLASKLEGPRPADLLTGPPSLAS